MGAHLSPVRASRRSIRVLLAIGLPLVTVAACASSGAPRDAGADTTASAATSSSPTSVAATTSAVTTVPEATTTTTAAPTTTEAPTTTTTIAPDPVEVACPEVPPPSRDVSASADRDELVVPDVFVEPRTLPAGAFAVRADPPPAQAAAAAVEPADRDVLARLAGVPTAFSVGDWLGDGVTTAVARYTGAAADAGSVAVLQIYNLPYRDAGGGFSAGGAADADAYRAFTAAVVAGIGAAPTIVILEPDSIGQMRSLSAARQRERYQLLNEAVDAYAALPNAFVYLDGTHCGWLSVDLTAQRLLRAGVARAQGFFVNVANYQPTDAEVWRAHQIALLTGNRHFVVDSGRNGNGPYPSALSNRWCNPPGRALGVEPTRVTTSRFADAYLWIKQPGASDGTCGRGNPAAGAFWPERALELARNAGW